MTDRDVAFASIEEIGKLFRKRKLSPVEVTKLMLERIERLNPKLNAYLTVTAEQALAQAKKAEAELYAPRGRKGHRDRGPLHGIPISLKDNIYTKDIRTTAGSKILRDFVPQHDALVVSQLKEAGAVLLGKTNLHEFAYGVTTNNPHFGPTRNPWSLSHIPGGSSGGSAAAVAAGLCYGSIGTDTGGSIRIPAALCGIVGLKPTFGRVSVAGVVPLSPRLDCVGPLARSSTDAALLLDPIFVRGEKEARLQSAIRPKSPLLRGFRVGVPKDFFPRIVSVEVEYAFEKAVGVLRKIGATLKEVSVPLLQEVEDAGNQIAWAEAAPAIGEETTAVCGTNHPTRALLLRNNRPANLGGLPAISVPCGLTPDGLPVGLQLIGAVTDEALLLRIAHAFECASAPLPRPSLAP